MVALAYALQADIALHQDSIVQNKLREIQMPNFLLMAFTAILEDGLHCKDELRCP